jgi:hypothetical protein
VVRAFLSRWLDPVPGAAAGTFALFRVRDAEIPIPKDARQSAERVIADITFRAAVKARQLPALEAWIARTAHSSSGREANRLRSASTS